MIVAQKFATAAEDHLQHIVSDHDLGTRKMRLILGLNNPISHPSVVRENAILAEGNADESTIKAERGVFHLILILRVLDISLFHEGEGGEANVTKIPKCLEAPIQLMASYV